MPPSRGRRLARTTVIAAGATVTAAALGLAGQRHAIRRARSRPDPDGDEVLEERPGTERRVRSFDGTDLAVNVVGPGAGRSGPHPSAGGPTIVMIHGFSADLTLWHFQWKRFGDGHRCVLFDQRGHGRSGPGAGGDYSLEALGRDVKAVLDAEAPDGPVVLMGHSMGGMAVLSLAALHPEEFGSRVRAVILANTSAGDVVKEIVGSLGGEAGRVLASAVRRLAGRPERVYRIRSRALSGRGDVAFLAARLMNFGPGAAPSMVEHVARIGARAPVEVWTDLLGSVMDMDLTDALHHVTVPALVVAGDLDRLTPPASALAIKRGLPQGRMVLFRGSGHCTMLERHEQFNDVVGDFLAQSVPAGPGPTGRGRRGRAPARKAVPG